MSLVESLGVYSSTRSGYRWAVGLSYCYPSSSYDDEPTDTS